MAEWKRTENFRAWQTWQGCNIRLCRNRVSEKLGVGLGIYLFLNNAVLGWGLKLGWLRPRSRPRVLLTPVVMFTNKTSVLKTGKFGEERSETKLFDACHTRYAVFFTPPSSWASSLLSALRSSLIHMTSNQVILDEWKQRTSHRNNDDQRTTEETIVRIDKPWVWFNNENFLITSNGYATLRHAQQI